MNAKVVEKPEVARLAEHPRTVQNAPLADALSANC
jgi:hypothetical protein